MQHTRSRSILRKVFSLECQLQATEAHFEPLSFCILQLQIFTRAIVKFQN